MSAYVDAYIGIDIGAGPKPVTFVALDEYQQALAIGDGDLPDVLAFAAGQSNGAIAAVNAAARPSRGRIASEAARREAKGRHGYMRQLEFELIQAGFEIPPAPPSADKGLPWVKRGFALVERLETMGYLPFPHEDAPRQWLEIQADAAFWSLLGVHPLPAGTLEGRIQRQLALLDQGLSVPDAMEFFEEITRFKILKSNLPTKNIFPQAEINAWIAAQTAWLAHNQPERVQRFGEPVEGFLFLPCCEKK